MAFFTWKKVNAQVLSVSACVKEWSKQQPGILKEFAAKEAVWKAAIVDVYNGASGAEKVILRNPTEDVIKANPDDAQKLISQLSGKGVPGFRFLDVNVPKLGVGLVSMPVAAAFRPVAGLLPPEESAVRMPGTVADPPVAKVATVAGSPATVPTSTLPAAVTGTNGPDSNEAEIAPVDDMVKAGQTSTSSMGEAGEASTNITDEELPDAGQASTSTMDDKEAIATREEITSLKDSLPPAVTPVAETSGAATEENAPGAVSHQTPPKAEAGVKVLDKGAVGLSLIERQASIHDDYVKLDSDTIAMFLQEHGEEEDGEGGDGFSGAAKSVPGTTAGAIMRPTSKATAPSNLEASLTESATKPSSIDQLAESTSSTSAAVPFQPKGVVEDLLSDAFAAVEEAGGDTSVVGDRVSAVAAAPLAATPEPSKGLNAVTTLLEKIAMVPAHVVADAKASPGVAEEVTKEVFQQKVDDEVKNVIASHAEMPVKQAVSSLDEKAATSVIVPPEVGQFPMPVEDGQTPSAMNTDDKEEIWADAEAVMREDFDLSSAENSRTASPAKVNNSRTASPAKLKPEEDTGTTPAKVAAGDAVGTPVKSGSVGAKVAFFDAVMSPAKLSFRDSGAALAKVASDDPVFSLGKSSSGETVASTPAKKASNDAVDVLKGLVKDEALVKVSASELNDHAMKDSEASEHPEHAMKDSVAEVEASASAKPEITEVLNAAAAAAHNIGLARADEGITLATEDGVEKRAQEDTKVAVEDTLFPATTETAAEDTLEELLPVAMKTAVERSPLPEVTNTAVEGVLLPAVERSPLPKSVVKVEDTSLPVETRIADEETSLPTVTEITGAGTTISAAAETAAEDNPVTPVKTYVEDTPVEVEATPLSASVKAAEGEGDEKAAPESGGKVQNIIKKIFGGGRSRESSPRAEASPSALAVEKLGISSGLVSKGVAVMESLAQEQSPPAKEKEALAASGSGAVSSESSHGTATVAGTTAEAKDKDAVPVATSLSTPLKEASTSAFVTQSNEAPTSAFSTPLKEAPTSAFSTPVKEASTSAFSTPLKEAATFDTAPSLATPAAGKEAVKVSANGATEVAEVVPDTKAAEESDEVLLTSREVAASVAEPAVIMTQFAGLAPEAGSEASEATESVLPGGQGAVSTAADSSTASTGTASSDVKGLDESVASKISAVASSVSDKHEAGETAPVAVEARVVGETAPLVLEAHVGGETAPLAVEVPPAKKEKLEVSAGDEKQTGDTPSHADDAKVIPAKATPARVSSKHRRSLSSTLFSKFIEKERSEPLAETVKDVETLTPIAPPKRRRNSSSLFGCFSKPKAVQ